MSLSRVVSREEFEEHIAEWPRKLERFERNNMIAYFDFKGGPRGIPVRVADYRMAVGDLPERDYTIWKELR